MCMRLSHITSCILLAACLSLPNGAFANVPEVVGDYVAYCKLDGNFDDCHGVVVRVAFANATSSAMRARGDDAGAKDKQPICNMVPGAPDEGKSELKRIVDWLSQHAETHRLKIEDGLNRAFGAIRNDCR